MSFDTRHKVDPWKLMATAMAASGQNMPAGVTLDNNGLMYAALEMEELGEKLSALYKILMSCGRLPVGEEENRFAFNGIMSTFARMGRHLQCEANSIRDKIKAGVDWTLDVKDTDAAQALFIELGDGVTDLMVVAAGFSIACGFPGAAMYGDVAKSNLSKRNPATGKIDKDGSGKWIKGVNFRLPDLAPLMTWTPGVTCKNPWIGASWPARDCALDDAGYDPDSKAPPFKYHIEGEGVETLACALFGEEDQVCSVPYDITLTFGNGYAGIGLYVERTDDEEDRGTELICPCPEHGPELDALNVTGTETGRTSSAEALPASQMPKTGVEVCPDQAGCLAVGCNQTGDGAPCERFVQPAAD